MDGQQAVAERQAEKVQTALAKYFVSNPLYWMKYMLQSIWYLTAHAFVLYVKDESLNFVVQHC